MKKTITDPFAEDAVEQTLKLFMDEQSYSRYLDKKQSARSFKMKLMTTNDQNRSSAKK